MDGKLEFHPEFLNRYNDYKAWFKEEFEQKVIDEFGEDGWAIFFTQVTQNEPYFYVDIFLDGINHKIGYEQIAIFTTNHLKSKGFKCVPFLRGTLQDYIQGK